MAAYFPGRGINLDAITTSLQTSASALQSGISSASESIWRLAGASTVRILRARLPRKSPDTFWDVHLQGGRIKAVEAHDPTKNSPTALPGTLDACGRLLAPSLCHPHIHLDKCFLLQDPKYAHLEVVHGDFDEAMQLTSEAKKLFVPEDLVRRGGRLIEESMESGVTAIRGFVEVDEISQLNCLDAGIKLKAEFDGWCDVQICAFAQLALFSGEGEIPEQRRALMEEAISRQRVDAIGSTPYVEADLESTKANITWVIEKALASSKHVDFHLDYTLDAGEDPMVWFVLDELKRLNWPLYDAKAPIATIKTVCLGHCTRLTRFLPKDWRRLREAIGDLPVHFIGLPTSDLYMMGRPEEDDAEEAPQESSKAEEPAAEETGPKSEAEKSGNSQSEENADSTSNAQTDAQPGARIETAPEQSTKSRPLTSSADSQTVRGTLPVPTLIRKYSLNCALGVNNVGNAFTPQGNCDPLGLASWGVALYHAGTKQDAEILYECISTRAKAALGLEHGPSAKQDISLKQTRSPPSSPSAGPKSPQDQAKAAGQPLLPGPASLDLLPGEPADLVLYGSKEYHWRRRRTLAELVYDPSSARKTLLRGAVRKQQV